MKTCPICQSGTFDDADVCYGCLHRFEEGEGFVDAASVASPVGIPGAKDAVQVSLGNPAIASGGTPALIISVHAVQGGQGGVEWCCGVDGNALSVSAPVASAVR